MINFLEQQEIIGHGNLVNADVLAVPSWYKIWRNSFDHINKEQSTAPSSTELI